jgi:hypothetical protein
LDKKHNAIRLSTIILDIGTKVIRAHIQRFLVSNKYNNFNELIHNKIVSKEMLNKLKKGCFGNIPDSLDKFDITKSFALIDNIFNELHKTSKFNYDDKSYDNCKRLKNIRNQKYAHIFFFEMEDVDFSVTVVTIEEIIRQLCDYDNILCKDYLDKIKIELNKDNSEINNLKSDVIKMLAEQKEEFEMFITKLTTSLSDSTDSAVRSLGNELKAFISTEVVQSQKDLFIQLIDRMKEIEECKSLMFQAVMSEFHEQTEIIKQIDSKTSKIEPNHAEIKEKFKKIDSKLDTIINKPETSTIDLASNLPPCPLASKLYNRENKTEIFAKLPDYKLSCIAGMAGVGKSTLAITYGHHRKQVHQAKVFIFLKNV